MNEHFNYNFQNFNIAMTRGRETKLNLSRE